jgi:hypothetical protein
VDYREPRCLDAGDFKRSIHQSPDALSIRAAAYPLNENIVRLVVEGDGRQTRKFPSVNGSDRRRRCGTLMESATCQFPCPLSRSMEVQTPDPAEHRTRECEYCHAEMVRFEKLPGINIRTVLEIFHCRGCNNYASRGHAAPFRRALRPVKTRRSKCFINCEAPVCTCCSAALLRGRHLVRTPSGGFLFGPIGKANIQVRIIVPRRRSRHGSPSPLCPARGPLGSGLPPKSTIFQTPRSMPCTTVYLISRCFI